VQHQARGRGRDRIGRAMKLCARRGDREKRYHTEQNRAALSHGLHISWSEVRSAKLA
jgi:hypothetical protein